MRSFSRGPPALSQNGNFPQTRHHGERGGAGSSKDFAARPIGLLPGAARESAWSTSHSDPGRSAVCAPPLVLQSSATGTNQTLADCGAGRTVAQLHERMGLKSPGCTESTSCAAQVSNLVLESSSVGSSGRPAFQPAQQLAPHCRPTHRNHFAWAMLAMAAAVIGADAGNNCRSARSWPADFPPSWLATKLAPCANIPRTAE